MTREGKRVRVGDRIVRSRECANGIGDSWTTGTVDNIWEEYKGKNIGAMLLAFDDEGESIFFYENEVVHDRSI